MASSPSSTTPACTAWRRRGAGPSTPANNSRTTFSILAMNRLALEPSRDPADYAFVHRLRTRFAETDAMGVIHHASYLPYLEETRVEYLRSIGHPYDAVRAGTDEPAPGGRAGATDGRR